MCGVIPIATSLLSPPPPNGLNGTSALLLSSHKPEQQNFPESHKAAPLAGASWSDPNSTTGEAGLGALSPTLQQGWVRSVPSWLGCAELCPQLAGLCTALSLGMCCPVQASAAHGAGPWGRGPGAGRGRHSDVKCMLSV